MENNLNAHQLENGWADWGPPLQWNPIQQQQQEGANYQHWSKVVRPKRPARREHEALVLLGFHWCNILVKAELWEQRWGEWLPGAARERLVFRGHEDTPRGDRKRPFLRLTVAMPQRTFVRAPEWEVFLYGNYTPGFKDRWLLCVYTQILHTLELRFSFRLD